ncbi:MAG: AAA family ATPase [Aquincola tertiaricarbonis]
MAMINGRIKVRSLEFNSPAFRKLANLKIEFAARLTVIAGHNGIGKSTIQGLVANTFGISKGGPKSYFGESYSANIERIVYLALSEVAAAQQEPSAAPTVVVDVAGVIVRKRCAMTQRSEWQRARVVPRTIDKADDDPVGQDAKVPLPTIYLGIKRLASIGEAEEAEVESKKVVLHDEDRQLMADFVASVIVGSRVNTDITHQSIRGARKRTLQPGYDSHDPLAVSMGQDSLASIATALASFNRLLREQGDDYRGGLLIIDELDVGFHPHAIDRLVRQLKMQANRLSLQIIATTHSPRLIEAVHPEGGGDARSPDKVIYLLDTMHPRLAEDQSLAAILDDMALRPDEAPAKRAAKPALCVYFEDPEAAQFCEALLPAAKRTALGRKLGVRIKLIPLGVSGSHLVGLPDKDPIFRDRVLIVDADTMIPRRAAARGNIIKLPCHKGATGTERSPENVIMSFLRKMLDAPSGPFFDALRRLSVTNPTTDRVRSTFFADGAGSSQRESSKHWWVNHWTTLERWGVIREWAHCHAEEAAAFISEFEAAAARTARRITG